MSTGQEKDIPAIVSFPGKIGRRLTLALGCLIAGVLLVGGLSLYLAESISDSTDKIKIIAEEIELLDRAHLSMHHLIEQLNRSIISGRADEAQKMPAVVTELEDHIKEYNRKEAGGYFGKGSSEEDILEDLTEEIALLTRLVEKVTGSIARGTQASQRDLSSIRMLDDKLREQFRELNRLHNSAITQELLESQTRMNIIIGLYLAFLVAGSLGLVGWSWVMSWTIVSPISNLASAAHEVARGNFDKRVPVTSKDEIGQLSHSFNFMAERIRDHEEKLKGLATLEERERIAQELHDSLAQDLALLHLKIIDAEKDLPPDGASASLASKEILREMRTIVEGAYEDVRQAILGLRTMVSKSLGLIPTLTEYLHVFSEQRGIPVDLKVDGGGLDFSAQAEIQIIRIIHEALNNIFKHAGATKSEVRFEREGKYHKVTVEDDGKGFKIGEVTGKGLHFGLRTMRERAEGVGGKLAIETAPGKGTKVIVYLPLKEIAYGNRSDSPGR